jgi:hypothetical protein
MDASEFNEIIRLHRERVAAVDAEHDRILRTLLRQPDSVQIDEVLRYHAALDALTKELLETLAERRI